MARLPILTHPHPVLRQKAAPVTAMTPDLAKLIEDMAETMYADDGVGLAAPQVGVSLRLIVCDPVASEEQGKQLMVLLNPEIVKREGEVEWEEGCLSVPGVKGWVTRAEKVVVKALDAQLQPITVEADELRAVCLQHELDHLDGLLFFDRIGPLKRKFLLKEYDKKKRETEKA
jgi:peptide deformylase